MCLKFLCGGSFEEEPNKRREAEVRTQPRQSTVYQEKRGTQVSSVSDGKAKVPTRQSPGNQEKTEAQPQVISKSNGTANQISSYKDPNQVPSSAEKKTAENDVETVKQIPGSTATKVNGSSEQQEPKILHKIVDQTGESKEQGQDKPTESVGEDEAADEKVENKEKKGYPFNRASKFGNGE